MVSEIVIRNRDGGGAVNRIYQSVVAVGQGAMVDPDIAAAEDGDAVAVRLLPPPGVGGGVPNIGVPRFLAVVDVDPMDDYVGGVVDGDARPVGDVHGGAAAVDGFVRVHHQFLPQPNHHVAFEDYP